MPLNFDLLTITEIIDLIGLDSFNRTVALKHYAKSQSRSFEDWYTIFEKDGITLPEVKKTRANFQVIEEIKQEPVVVEEDTEESSETEQSESNNN